MGERTVDAGRGRAGFTLLELLISIAAIVLLLAVLFPSVAAARRAAQEAACLGVQRRLTIAVLAHAGGNRDEIPGLNTTNRWWLRPPRANRLLGDTTPTTPTSVFDWISPVMGTEMGFSANRAERTRRSCPAWPGSSRKPCDARPFRRRPQALRLRRRSRATAIEFPRRRNPPARLPGRHPRSPLRPRARR